MVFYKRVSVFSKHRENLPLLSCMGRLQNQMRLCELSQILRTIGCTFGPSTVSPKMSGSRKPLSRTENYGNHNLISAWSAVGTSSAGECRVFFCVDQDVRWVTGPQGCRKGSGVPYSGHTPSAVHARILGYALHTSLFLNNSFFFFFLVEVSPCPCLSFHMAFLSAAPLDL